MKTTHYSTHAKANGRLIGEAEFVECHTPDDDRINGVGSGNCRLFPFRFAFRRPPSLESRDTSRVVRHTIRSSSSREWLRSTESSKADFFGIEAATTARHDSTASLK